MLTGNIRKRLSAIVPCAVGLLFFPFLIASSTAARGDDLSAALRYSFGNRSFPSDSFSTATVPGNTAVSTQLRISGSTILSDRFFSDYDLRYGVSRRTRKQNGTRTIETRSGLQDQSIGIGYQLDAVAKTPQWVRVSVVIPAGPFDQNPRLSSGQWAIEPVYGLSGPGPWNTTIGFNAGARVFVDGGSAQFRARLQISKPLTQDLRLSLGATLRRSALLGSYNPATDSGEISNILRPGVQVQYRLHENLSTYMSYEKYVAGKGGHASQRITFGLSFTY